MEKSYAEENVYRHVTMHTSIIKGELQWDISHRRETTGGGKRHSLKGYVDDAQLFSFVRRIVQCKALSRLTSYFSVTHREDFSSLL